MADRINILKDGQRIYDIVMDTSFTGLKEEADRICIKDHKVCIVTDSNVAPIYLEEVKSILAGICSHVCVYIFPAGEENKNLDTVKGLYEYLILEHFDRKDMLAALGGGVVGDLCGFAAATYLRGIDFFQIPTTLLSQVDSSIGGKTGVDFDAYKNMVGAFHMPRFVYTNLSTLLTLPKEQFSSGMGEVIKHGLIMDKAYYEWLKENRDGIMRRDLELCRHMVCESNRIKKAVVEEDPTEQGVRALLNFGHTLGHAVEKRKDFTMLHGHCVALGCVAAGYISHIRGNITAEEFSELRETLRAFGLPVDVRGLLWEDVYTATQSDKKMDAGVVKFILLRAVGSAYVDKTVSKEEMKAGFDCIGGCVG